VPQEARRPHSIDEEARRRQEKTERLRQACLRAEEQQRQL
jgi:hypothetical protein